MDASGIKIVRCSILRSDEFFLDSALALKLRKPIRACLHIPAPSNRPVVGFAFRASVVLLNATSLKAVGVELEVHLAA